MMQYPDVEPVVYEIQNGKKTKYQLYTAADKEHTSPLCVLASGCYSGNTFSALSLDAPVKQKDDNGLYLWERRARMSWVDFD